MRHDRRFLEYVVLLMIMLGVLLWVALQPAMIVTTPVLTL